MPDDSDTSDLKVNVGYFLSSENKRWVASQAKKEDRSASYWLDRLLTKLRKEAKAKEMADAAR